MIEQKSLKGKGKNLIKTIPYWISKITTNLRPTLIYKFSKLKQEESW